MASEGVKRRLAAILSADVAGYSKLMEADEETTVRTMASYRKSISSIIVQHNGRVVDSPGDNLLAEFSSVVEGVQCAVEIQHVIKAKNAVIPEARRMEFRIGISLEDVIEEGDRIYGDGVNVAARLESIADAGGICISGRAYDHIANKLALGYEDIGEHAVKNMSTPVQAYRIPMVSQTAAVDGAKSVLDRKWRHIAIGAMALLIVTVGAGSVLLYSHISRSSLPRETGKIETTTAPAQRPIPAVVDRPSIIVLPFDDLSPGKDNEYFSDGLTDEIITDLSQVRKLLVISYGTAMTFKGKDKKTRDIAAEVNVRYVLEGSVRKAGNDLRISAQLIDAMDDTHLWAERYTGTLDDVFDIQEKVSRSIVDALRLELSPEEEKRIAARPIRELQAYEYYLKAEAEIFRSREDSIRNALRYLQNAVDVIGDNALLYSGMAFACWSLANTGIEHEDYLAKAREYAEKALSLDPSASTSYAVLGLISQLQGRLLDSVAHFRKALAIDQDEELALMGLVNAYVGAGRMSAAAVYLERCIQVDPLHYGVSWWRGGLPYYEGRFALALHPWRILYEQDPQNPMNGFYLCIDACVQQ